MDSLVLSIEIVFPTIAIMMFGWFLNRIGCFSKEFVKGGTWFSFNIAVPMAIFMSLQGRDLGAFFNPALVIYMVLGLTVSSLLLTWIVPLFVKDRPRAAAMAQAMFRANFSVQGLPMLTKTYGAENIAPGAVTFPFLVVANNVLGTLMYVLLIPEQGGGAVKKALKKLIKNPLIIGSAAGVLAAVLKLPLAGVVLDTVNQIGRIGTPLILVCLGAEIDFGNLRRNLRYTLPTTFVRLVVVPGLLTLVGALLGFRGIELGTIYLFNASCTVVAGYVIAAAMGGDTAIAAESLGLTALFSSVTVTLGLTILLHFGLI
ncbi:MAG: AEC family transporter [Ruminococcaceae bacterium]|nr:AEC family transporter [Oscillospiraceae bacterium]